MPKLNIDGQELEVPAGTNLIEAAARLGIDVPHYCYHPALSVVASCRMCQVEMHVPDQPPRVIVACRTEAQEGMVISTQGTDCKKARQATLEFLLANHPLDCPICDKAGECDLQNFNYWHGAGQSRFSEPKRQALKHTPIGAHILLDQERCILCTRCVRFMDEYAKAPQLLVSGRGDRNVITTFPDAPLDSDYEGNLADICPVGALTLKEFRFQSRVWDLQHTDSVCPQCDRGCSIQLETKRNRLLRVRPRLNEKVNGHFICDRGRFDLLEQYNRADRVAGAFANGREVAVEDGIEALLAALESHAGTLLVVLSARLTCEEILLAQLALEGLLRKDGLVFLAAPSQPGDDILYTGREAANEAGLRALGVRGLSAGELGSLLEEEGSEAALFLDGAAAESVAARQKVAFLALLDLWQAAEPSDGTPHGWDLAIPGSLLSEKDGTLINFEGVMQRVRRAQRAPAGIRTEGEVFRRIGERRETLAQALLGPDVTADVFRALAQEACTLAQVPADGYELSLSTSGSPDQKVSA